MAKKSTDITKTGPQSYRDLQELNTLAPSDDGFDFSSWRQNRLSQYAPTSLFDARAQAEKEISSPFVGQETISGKPDFWGNSHFDKKTVNEDEFRRLSDIRAENQPWYSKLFNGVAKGGVLAATTALETAGLVYGIGQGIYDAATTEGGASNKAKAWLHGLWDNPITRTLQKVNDFAEEAMPNYYTQDELENPFGNIFTANFLGDKLIKNLGFMVGAFYGGIPAAKLVGKAGTAAVKNARAASLAERAGMAQKVNEITQQAERLGMKGDDAAKWIEDTLSASHLSEAERGRKIVEGMDKVRNMAQATRYTSQVIGALGSAVNEGAIEAINNSRDWARQMQREANDNYQQTISDIEALYGDTPEGQELMQVASDSYQARLEEIEKGRATMGNADLLLNLPVLLASNVYQLGRLYNRGFDSTRREMGSIFNGHKLSGSLAEGTLKTSKTRKGAIASALLKSNTEGLEEYLQRAASDGAGQTVSDAIDRFFMAGKSENSKADIDDFLVGFGKAAADNLDDPNAWEEYMIGAVSSMIGMPVFGSQTKNAWLGQGKAVGLAGGIKGNYEDYMSDRDKEETVAKYLNKRVKEPEFKALYDNLKKRGDLDKLIREAVLNKDKMLYKDIELEKLFSDLNAAASSGHFSEFMEMVGYNNDYTDDELADIAETTTHLISAKEQKDSDIARRDKILSELDWYDKYGIVTEAEKGDAYELNKELDEIEQRISADSYQDKIDGPFVMSDINGNLIHMNATEEGKEEMRNILEKNRQHLLDSMKMYLKLRNDIDIETDGKLTDEQIELLTQLRAKIWDIDKRSAEMTEDLLPYLASVRDNMGPAIEQGEKAVKDLEDSLKEAKDSTDKETIQTKLDKARKDLDKMKSYSRLLEYLSQDKKASVTEQVAQEKGYQGGSLLGAFGTIIAGDNERDYSETRHLNADEVSGTLSHPGNAMAVIESIKADPTIDSKTKMRLIEEVADLSVLSNNKLAYNDKVREFLDPNKINEAFNNSQQKLTKEEEDNKADELALRIQKTRSMTELNDLMKNAMATNTDIADKAIEKAKAKDEETKSFVEDYTKTRHFFTEINKQLADLSPTEASGISSSILEIWEDALANNDEGNLYDKFINGINSYRDALEEESDSGNKTAERDYRILDKLLKDIEEAKQASSTNSKVTNNPEKEKKSNKNKGAKSGKTSSTKTSKVKDEEEDEEDTDNDEGVDDADRLSDVQQKAFDWNRRIAAAETPDALEKTYKDAIADGIPKEYLMDAYDDKKEEFDKANQPESIEDLERAIKQDIRSRIDNKQYPTTIDGLSDTLQERVRKYNSENPKTPIEDSQIAKWSQEIADSKLADEHFEEPDEEDIDSGGGSISVVGARMHDMLVRSFKSDYPTLYTSVVKIEDRNVPLYYKSRFDPPTEQGKNIQKLLEDYCAYSFLDKNFLGYLYRAYASKNEELPIYFVKSTQDNINGEKPIIFLAIKYGSREENIIKRASGLNNLEGLTEPVDIDNERYHIVGTLSYSVADASPSVITAFSDMQKYMGKQLDAQIQDAKREAEESGEEIKPFVIAKTKGGDLLTSKVTSINTGRLEKRHVGTDDSREKRSLDELLSESSEWKSGQSFQFGVVVRETTGVENVQQPNPNWMSKHQGAILMFVPKPDGQLYPIRCTRRTVGDWLSTHRELLSEVLNGDVDNDYLQHIIEALKVLFSDDSSLNDRLSAKYDLSQYFIFGEKYPIHVDDDNNGGVSFKFTKGTEVTEEVLDDFVNDGESLATEEGKINAFFNMLAKHNILFSLPNPTKETIDGRSVVASGILETGLKGFYNFGANFTVQAINYHGDPINVPASQSGESYDIKGNEPEGFKEFEINGEKKYYIQNPGTGEITYADGNIITDEVEKSIVLQAISIQNNGGPLLIYRYLPQDVDAEVKDQIISYLKNNFGSVYTIEQDGETWIYDRTGGGKNNVIYKLTKDKRIALEAAITEAQNKMPSSLLERGVSGKKTGGKDKNTDKKTTEKSPVSTTPGTSRKSKKESKPSQSDDVTPKGVYTNVTMKSLKDVKTSIAQDLLRAYSNPKKKAIAEDLFSVIQMRETAGLPVGDNDIGQEVKRILAEKDEDKADDMLEKLKSCDPN